MLRRLHFGYALLFFAAGTAAQNRPCEVEIPLNIVLPGATLVRNVPNDGLIVRHGGDVLKILSVNADSTSRRIVLVVENGKRVNLGARKVEASMLDAIVTNARQQDSLALITTQGLRRELPFGTPRDLLLSAVRELSVPVKEKDQSKSPLETLLEAVALFQGSKAGDSIIFLTMGLDPLGDTEYDKARKVLSAAGIRLFGFQLGRLYLGIYSLGLVPNSYGSVMPEARIDPNRETMFDLADETGGFFLGENTEGDSQQSYEITDHRLQLLNKFAGQLYKAIAEYYSIRLVAPPKGLTIDLNESLRQKLPKAHLTYPRKIPPC